MKTNTRTIAGQRSWRLANDTVELFVTEIGGHVGPVVFNLGGRRLCPLSVAPWAEEKGRGSLPPIIKVLRGDFFCLPFGGNAATYHGEQHPIHGETANCRWRLLPSEADSLRASLTTRIRPGVVEKLIRIRSGHAAVYSRHTVAGMSGPMCLGHHAMLQFPPVEHAGLISTSPFVHGQVFVEPTERPENRGYSILKPAAEFQSLDSVPTITGTTADLSRFPARRGFEDIAMLVTDPTLPFAWSAVVFPGERYAWFALKNPRVLRGTVLWISNGGRHYPPWNGRHVNVLALEEVTSYFHYGLAESARPNDFSRRGWPTCLNLDPATPLVVNYIQAVTRVPRGFDRVTAIESNGRGDGVVLIAASGRQAACRLDLSFLASG